MITSIKRHTFAFNDLEALTVNIKRAIILKHCKHSMLILELYVRLHFNQTSDILYCYSYKKVLKG